MGFLNDEFPRQYAQTEEANEIDVEGITEEEVFDAIKDSKNGKAVGPDGIPAEFWKKMGAVGVTFLTTLIRKLLRGDRMPHQWRESYIIPLYKGKGDTRDCNNF